MKPVIIKPSSHDEWLAARDKGIGASEVGAILGLSPFETAFSLWLKKTNQVPREPENEAMLMGHMLEDVVAKRWEMETGEKVIKASAADIIYVHPEHDFLRATPDRIVRGRKKLLECKTTVTSIDAEDIPAHWQAQVIYQMYVTGIHDADLAWLVQGRYFGYAHIQYDEEFANFIVQKVTEFWNDCVIGGNVKGGKEPELISVEDFAYKGSDPGTTIEADEEAYAQLLSLRTLKVDIAGKAESAEAYTNSIKLYMGKNESLTYKGDVLATWKTGARGRQFRLKDKLIDELLAKNEENGN